MTQPHRYPFEELDGLAFHPRFAALREEGALARVRLPYGGEAWLATRHEVVKFVVTDPRFSLAATLGRDVPRDTPLIETTRNLMNLDPPEHTRLRRLTAQAFTPRRVDRLRPRAVRLAGQLVDQIRAHGPPVDLIHALAAPFPALLFCELFGIPEADREWFRAQADVAMALSAYPGTRIADAREELRTYIASQVRRRRRARTDDLLGALVHARDVGDQLTHDELLSLGWLFLAADKTTTDLLGNVIYLLLTHPMLLARLRGEPVLPPAAIEELLRITPLGAGAGFARIATRNLHVDDILVRAGDAVLVKMSAANRDPRVFDSPDDIDLERDPNPHLAFGHGAHYCPAAQLTRMQLEVVLGTLLHRLPDLALAVPTHQVRWKRGRRDRGPHALPVTWNR